MLAGIEELRDLLQEAKDEEANDAPAWMQRLKSQILHLDRTDRFTLELEVAKILKSWDSKINSATPLHKQLICDWLLSNDLVDYIFICHKKLRAVRTVTSESTGDPVKFGTKALTWTAPDAFEFLQSIVPGLEVEVEEDVLFVAEVTARGLAASDGGFLDRGQQIIRIEAPSFTPTIQELAEAMGSSSPCSVSFRLNDTTDNVASPAKPDDAAHTLNDKEVMPAGPLTELGPTRHTASSDILYYTRYIGLGDYPAQMKYQVKIVRDDRISFPKTIPVHIVFRMNQSSTCSKLLRVGWSGEMKDTVFVDWESTFLYNIDRPIRYEVTQTQTTKVTLGGAFPASFNLGVSRSETRAVTTEYDCRRPFDVTYLNNGDSFKEMCIKPSATSEDGGWTNLDFETQVSQFVLRSPRGLVSRCQAVYRHIPYVAECTRIKIGTEYVIVAQIDIPRIDDERTDIELEHGSDYLVNMSKDEDSRSEQGQEGQGERQAEGEEEARAEGWFKRTIRRLRDLPRDRCAEQDIGRTDVGSGQTASTIHVASMPAFRPQWYNLFAKDSTKLSFVKATTGSDLAML